jgi:hypothetical protein
MSSEGVHSVLVTNGRRGVAVSGRSLYWLRQVGDDLHVGGATLGYGEDHVVETIVHPDGTQQAVRREFVPDLAHDEVKLGWWWPGTEGAVNAPGLP